jgi:hypothetical protein
MTTHDFLRRSTFVLGCALALAGCGSGMSSPVPASARRRAHDSPQHVLAQIRSDAQSRGGRVADEGPDSVLVDFGVTDARVAVADDATGASSALCDTEIHCTALYVVTAAEGGASVVVFDNPVYWHPVERIWLPGPAGVAPGRELLRDFDGASRSAVAR